MKLKRLKRYAIVLGMMMACGTATYAQMPAKPAAGTATVSDAAIKEFVAINKEMMPAQMEAQQQMMAVLKAEDMEPQRFQAIAMAQQQNKIDEAEATAEELAAFKTASQKITTIQQGLQKDMAAAIEESGMDQMEFQKVAMAYQQDPEMRKKIDGMMQQ